MKIRNFPSVAAAACILLCGSAEAKVTASQGYPSQITLTWEKNEQADGYRICRRENSGDWCVLADLTDTIQYTDVSAEEGITYSYSVRPFEIDDRQVYWMEDEVIKNVCILPPTPKDIQVTAGETGGNLELTWKIGEDSSKNSLLCAVSYFEVYVKEADDLTWKFLASTESQPNRKETSFLLEDADAGSWYTVRSAYRTTAGETVYSAYDEAGTQGSAPTAATARIYHAVSNGTKGNEIAWVSLSDKATKLEILRKDEKSEFQRIKMIVDQEEIQDGSYTDTDVTTTDTYWYTVRTFLEQDEKQISGWYETDGVAVTVLPNMPTLLTASYLASDTPCIQIGWDANENTEASCDGYHVYRKGPQDSEWQLLGTNSGANNTLFMDASVEKGDVYEYRVLAYKESASGDFIESNTPDAVRAAVPKQ